MNKSLGRALRANLKRIMGPVSVTILLGNAACGSLVDHPTQPRTVDSTNDSVPLHVAGDEKSQADQRLVNASSEPQNWLTHGGTYAEQRYSTLDEINNRNVGKLGLAWSYELDTDRGQETTPLIVDGVIYLTTSWSKVVALDGDSGKKLWQYDPKVTGEAGAKACCDVVNRGAAYYDGKVFVAALDGRLIALDAKTGNVLWSTLTFDQSKPYTSTGAPRVIKGKVIIGNAGAEFGVRGYITAYDANSGQQVWRFYTVPGDPVTGPDGAASDDILKSKATATWSGQWWKFGGGGTVWDSIVYDAELDQLYIGVGNGSPWNHKVRSEGKGDNLFLSSIVALDPDTGKYRWHYQINPGDSWDYTATQPIMLATLEINGVQRMVLMQAPKNGFFYVIDRTNGKFISANNFVPVNWATGIDPESGRPIEVPAARYVNEGYVMKPSPLGGHSWQPMAFSPKTNLVYLPTQDVPFLYANDPDFKIRPGLVNNAINYPLNTVPTDMKSLKALRATLKGTLVAWDPIHQREAWHVSHTGPANGGVLATAGNLVFEGTADGKFEAFDAASGERLWSFKAQTEVIGSPVSYGVENIQYVAVVSGSGGAYSVSSPFVDNKSRKPKGRVLAFTLGGTATLPPFSPPALALANPPTEHFTPLQIVQGKRIFENTCGFCHGAGGVSGGVIPDLRRSAALSNKAVWNSIVIDGVLKDRGMISFATHFTPEEIESVRAYVAEKARALRDQESSRRTTAWH